MLGINWERERSVGGTHVLAWELVMVMSFAKPGLVLLMTSPWLSFRSMKSTMMSPWEPT